MAKTKRQYILATCFLSGAAAIISFVSLGTQEWVTSKAELEGYDSDVNTVRIGLFGGVFKQSSIHTVMYDLSTVCRFDLNVCALLCGDNMSENLEKIYNHEETNQTKEDGNCANVGTYGFSSSSVQRRRILPRADDNNNEERIFINAGVWLCTIIFLIISAVMGLFAAGLAVWNTASNPIQVYFSVFGLYIYNAVAFFTVLLAIILWGAMYAHDLIKNIPCYKTFFEGFTTENLGQLGYSYWILLASLFFYMGSICLLYIRDYLISKEPEVNVHIEDNADPVIYLY